MQNAAHANAYLSAPWIRLNTLIIAYKFLCLILLAKHHTHIIYKVDKNYVVGPWFDDVKRIMSGIYFRNKDGKKKIKIPMPFKVIAIRIPSSSVNIFIL